MSLSNTNTGGPAFPIGSGDMRDPTGMTLRDYFAANAMQGFCGNAANRDALPGEIAGGAYLVADAMLKAREGV